MEISRLIGVNDQNAACERDAFARFAATPNGRAALAKALDTAFKLSNDDDHVLRFIGSCAITRMGQLTVEWDAAAEADDEH